MIRRAASLLAFGALVFACASESPPRGGLVVTVSNDGTLLFERIKVQVFARDALLLQNEVAIPETPIPNTLSIVSNGLGTTTATIVVSAWRGGLPVDRRDAIVSQIPSDRLASLRVVLSARCSAFVKAGADPAAAESTCGPSQTCDPGEGRCVSAEIDARKLPSYGPGETPIAEAGGGGCTSDEACASVLALAGTTPEGCAIATCNPETKRCVYRAKDKDGDGRLPKDCSAPAIAIETGDDCDDADSAVHPGAWDGPPDDTDSSRAESCEGKDNDCNGKIDDGRTASGRPCTCLPNAVRDCAATPDGAPITYPTGNPLPGSICRRGTQTCGGDGQWGPCAGAVAPRTRDCSSGLDNDCDGKPDNTIDAVCKCSPGFAQSCFPYPSPARATSGPCRAGSQTCQASGGTASWGACTGAAGPIGNDTCEPGNDNDCDGTPNAGCPCVTGQQQGCAGTQCGTGTRTCNAGSWGPCLGIIGPAIACTSPPRCGFGTRACVNGIYASGCDGTGDPRCPADYVDGPVCTKSATLSLDMHDDAGGDGFPFGRLGIPFPQRGSVSSRVSFSYVSGGCWSSTTPDSVALSCTAATRSVTQCDSSSPPNNGCPGQSFSTGSSTSCDFSKIRGWTPSFQGVCVRRATMTFTDTLARGCY